MRNLTVISKAAASEWNQLAEDSNQLSSIDFFKRLGCESKSAWLEVPGGDGRECGGDRREDMSESLFPIESTFLN
jgi:hypothetical protein